jgi:hypothetical protein
MYHKSGTSVKTPLCYFHNSLPTLDMFRHIVNIQVVCESVPPENTDLPCPLDWGAFGTKLLGVLIGNGY